MRCDICLKAGMTGNNVSHSNRHTKTRFMANCLRSLSKSAKVRKAVAALA